MTNLKEKFFKFTYLGCAIFGIIAVLLITVFLLAQGIPGIMEIGIFKFLFGTEWIPSENQFGILPMIIASIVVTTLATTFGVVLGVFSAAFLAFYCPKKLYKILKSVINVLAGIPSVIFGFFGMELLVPIFNNISPTGIGNGTLVSSIILAIMILPTIISVSLSSMNNVPKQYYEGAVSLGATHNQAVFKVVLPACKNGIMSATILGVGRAIGEAMAVKMVAGNVPNFPTSFFTSIRTLTSNIVVELGYAEEGLHLNALIATGVVLFIFILVITLSLNLISNKKNVNVKANIFTRLKYRFVNNSSKNLKLGTSLLKYLGYLSIILTCISLLSVVLFIVIKGVPHVSFDFIFGSYTNSKDITLLPSIVTTLILIGGTLILAVPIGIGSAIYLSEYTKKGSKLVKTIRSAIETLAGIPSIVYGLFGNLFFVAFLGFGYSILAGILTLVLMILPTIIRTTEQALLEVPESYREGSYALGAGKTRTIFKVVLPSAISGIVTGIVLSIGRIVGESAALLLTVGSTRLMPSGLMSSGISLSVFMYVLSGEGLHVNEAYGAAFVLLTIVLLINILASILESKLKLKSKDKTKNKRKKVIFKNIH